MEHEYYSGISLAIMAIVAVKKLGPGIAAYCDKEIDVSSSNLDQKDEHKLITLILFQRIESEWNESRVTEVKDLSDAIEGEKKEQWCAEGQLMLVDAKKENVALQLEAAYRERAMTVYNEVKRRLDYQVQRQNIDRRISQKHQVQWVVDSVLKSLTPDQEKETLNKCIADLGAMASRK